MRVVAINSSPKMDNGNTSLILNPFLEGMKETGAEIELFYTKNLKINPCQGDFSCSLKNPGICFQKDDMQMLHPKLFEADIWVFASPLYISGFNGPMKVLIDRILTPVGEPYIGVKDGRCHHPIRENIKRGKLVLVSSCGYWEIENFDLLIAHMKEFSFHSEWEFVGALLRPHAPALKPMIRSGAPIYDIFEAAKKAGHQLIMDGKMSSETLSIVSRELLPMKEWVRGNTAN
ncbi:MAG: flavodoxin family protein [Candidatus Heimdallarchaeota archaeon]|nr:MAG: flavodoxin family protein [Candidatus Heimdallarchaeota archaeon]